MVLAAYDPRRDHRRLLEVEAIDGSLAKGFDNLRKLYPLRREFGFRQVDLDGDSALAAKVRAIGFSCTGG